MKIKNKRNTVFLTFDDGPEPKITEFVLDELKKYNFKATFFCRGDNAEKNPNLIRLIVNEGHALGNHTYSHLNSSQTSAKIYVSDVERANSILKSHFFRPPWGRLTFLTFLYLVMKYKIVYWSVTSGDTEQDCFEKSRCLTQLITNTSSGDIVLFHFCHRHEKETRQLLPDYLRWLYDNGFHSEIIK